MKRYRIVQKRVITCDEKDLNESIKNVTGRTIAKDDIPHDGLVIEMAEGKNLPEVRTVITVDELQEMKVEKVGRNDPCPCGSGEKYKKCHGKK